jgi:glycosyltransferase involved in cell wall biosynthesis
MTVTVALAIYNPDAGWLEAQLRSIAAQTYRNIELLAIDDASRDVPFADTEAIFSSVFNGSGIRYKLMRNAQNLGSSQTFAKLTGLAQGEYISYCDQDDIWLPHKTAALLDALKQSDAPLAYSNLSVINGAGVLIADSLPGFRKRLRHLEGQGLAPHLLFRNFTNGTAMMMPADTAKSALPFPDNIIADHWLTLWAAAKGRIVYLPEPLVKYRLHGSNQSAVMAGVHDKKSYFEHRILKGQRRFEQYKTRLAHHPGLTDVIRGGALWFDARGKWFAEGSGFYDLWRRREWGKQVTVFELLAARLPSPVFTALIRLVQRGII